MSPKRQRLGIRNVDFDSYTVLVVEDEPMVRRALLRALATYKQPLRTLAAANGKQALQVLERHPVDVVLSDISMPEMDGWEFLEATRAKHPDLTLVVVTGNKSPDIVQRCEKLGVSGLVSKPVETDELCQHLDIVLAIARKRGSSKPIPGF
jgi:CheY-like chemotaxis protein